MIGSIVDFDVICLIRLDGWWLASWLVDWLVDWFGFVFSVYIYIHSCLLFSLGLPAFYSVALLCGTYEFVPCRAWSGT